MTVRSRQEVEGAAGTNRRISHYVGDSWVVFRPSVVGSDGKVTLHSESFPDGVLDTTLDKIESDPHWISSTEAVFVPVGQGERARFDVQP